MLFDPAIFIYAIFSRVYPYVTRVYSYVTRVYSYVTRMYSYVTPLLLVCTRVLLVCTRILLVCSFRHDHYYSTASCLCQAVFYVEQIENGSRLHEYTCHDRSVFFGIFKIALKSIIF